MEEKFLESTLDYDIWASAKVIERCAKLTDEELNRGTGIGRGTIGAELAHLVQSYTMFGAVLAGEQPQPSPNDLLESFKIASDKFKKFALELANEDRWEEAISIPWSGASISKLVWMHTAFDHSAYHRSELEIMLAGLGLEAFPGVSVPEWAIGR
jgi:uncharacterized damage-inducible protein DinB